MKNKLLANLVFGIHTIIVAILLIGWNFYGYWYSIYIGLLLATLVSEIVLGYCILSKWEFDLRKKQNPNLNYDYTFLSYYAYKFLKKDVPSKIIKPLAWTFLIISLMLNIFFLMK